MNDGGPRDEFDEGGPDDRDGLAAEYALGTLDPIERAELASRLDVDPELAAAVARWDALLAPLTLSVPEVAPPAHVWQGLAHRLDVFGGAPGRQALRLVQPSVPAEDVRPAPPPRRAAMGWRTFALAASLAAIVFGGLLARDRLTVAPPSEPLVAVLQSGGQAPAYLVSVDVARKQLSVRRVGAPAPAQNAHELWLVSDAFGKPVSLGLVGAEAATAPRGTGVGSPSGRDPETLRGMDPMALADATYAISLEPQGGSPTGQPTGPVLFTGKLIELPEAFPTR